MTTTKVDTLEVTLIKTNTIDANVAATTLNIGTNGTGAINIGTSGSRTGLFTIGNSSSSGAIKLASRTSVKFLDAFSSTDNISIGSLLSTGVIEFGNPSLSTSSCLFSNKTTFSSGITTTNVEPLYSGGLLEIGYTQTNEELSIGSGDNRTVNAFINIGTGENRVGQINIGNGLTNSGSINIANGTGATQTSAVNISTGSTTGLTTIGNSANTMTINSGTVNIPSGLTYSYTVLPAYTVQTQQGYNLLTSLGASFLLGLSNATTSVLSASTTIPIGVYTISYAIRINSSSVSTPIQNIQAGLTLNGGDNYALQQLSGNTFTVDTAFTRISFSGSWTGKITSTQTIILKTFCIYTGVNQPQAITAGQGTYISITRIA